MISKFFISRPIVAIVIAIVTVIGGLVAMAGLPVAQFPDIVPPQIIVSTTYTGADAVTIEQSVATPLEQQMSGVDKMLYMQSYTTIDGFSLLNRISVTYNGFFFISLQPWDERKHTAAEIQKSINARLASEVPDAIAFSFGPPAIPGLGNAGGFSFWLQDRSGGSVEFLDQNLQKFLAAARERPELAGVFSPFSANTPQLFADVDRDKVLKQGDPIDILFG